MNSIPICEIFPVVVSQKHVSWTGKNEKVKKEGFLGCTSRECVPVRVVKGLWGVQGASIIQHLAPDIVSLSPRDLWTTLWAVK